jgi:hypothetical protein
MSLLKNNLIAHNVKTEGNVASTFHIEPSHNPKAGEISQAWFALTKPGGEVIPLDRCNCQLKIIANNQTVLQPALQAISAEQYKGIPGADVTFPKAGIYTLEISGNPKVADEFNSFKFAYDVTVQAGVAAQPSPVVLTQPTQNSMGWVLPIAAGAIVVLTCAWIVKRTLKK